MIPAVLCAGAGGVVIGAGAVLLVAGYMSWKAFRES